MAATACGKAGGWSSGNGGNGSAWRDWASAGGPDNTTSGLVCGGGTADVSIEACLACSNL